MLCDKIPVKRVTCDKLGTLQYERGARRQALQRPLPRNWVPQADPVTVGAGGSAG